MKSVERVSKRGRQHSLLLWLVAGLGLFAAKNVFATEYYVATTGSDSNPGTEASPFATLQKAADTVAAGDTVWIRGGTYKITTPKTSGAGIQLSKSGTSDTNRIKYWAYPGETPLFDFTNLTISTSGYTFGIVISGNWVHLKGIEECCVPMNTSSNNGIASEGTNNIYAAPRDDVWWDAFFNAYSNLLYTYADIAQQSGVEELVVARSEVFPALPGNPQTPADIETRWRVLIRNVRLHYAGKLAVELPLTDAFPSIPQFFDEVDEFIVRVSGPVTSGTNSPDEMKTAAGALLDDKLADLRALGKPIFLAPAYASLNGADAGCPRDSLGSCLPLQSIFPGPGLALTLTPDFDAQTRAYQAMLLAASERDWISGFFPWGYYAPVALRDASPSIHGKPVEIYLAGMFNR